jgi:L-ascorbate metabolism protein UlaG (beta-lactamase superfamily)
MESMIHYNYIIRKRPRSFLKSTGFVFGLFLIGSGLAAAATGTPATQPRTSTDAGPTCPQLETVRRWFWQNSPNGKNREERRKRMAVIQAACDRLTPDVFWVYMEMQGKLNGSAARMEDGCPALCYLGRADRHAFEDIRATKVRKGLAVWHLYNMGYVFKTPGACFGIDIFSPGSEVLAGDLDFLLVTHEHGDHFWPPLMDRMIKAGKPVVTRWYPGSRVVNKPGEIRFGDVRVKIDIGDHHRNAADGKNNMLMYQVDCPTGDGTRTIYHSGDGNNYLKMHPDRKVDIYIPHVQVGMSIEESVRYLKPRMTFVSHVMELGHSPKPPCAWRWSFDYALEVIKGLPEDRAAVLTWGERWLTPGTVLEP